MYWTPKTIIYFNKQFVKASEASVNLYSQSLHYGYGVFEGIRAYPINGSPKLFKGPEHFDRLRKSCEAIHIPFDYSTKELVDLTYETLSRNNFTDAYIRPLVICSPNMSLSKGKESYLAIEAWEWTGGYLGNGMKVGTSSFRRPNPDGFHVECKVTGHYVNSIIACQQMKDKGYDEALVLDGNGFVAESSGANIFFENNGTLFTPPRGNILPGITRQTILELCQEIGIPVVEKLFTPEEMRGADAGFFCGTAAEVCALESLDDVVFKKKWENTISSFIQRAYKARVLEQPIPTLNE